MKTRLYVLSGVVALITTCLACPCGTWAQQPSQPTNGGQAITESGAIIDLQQITGGDTPESVGGVILPPNTKEIAEEQSIQKRREAARKLFLQQDYSKALTAYKNILAQYPEWGCSAGMGEVLAAMGRTREAIAAYQRAIYPGAGQKEVEPSLQEPHEPEIEFQYALLLAKTGQREEAFEIYQKALSDLYTGTTMSDLRASQIRSWLTLPFTSTDIARTFDRRHFDSASYTAMGTLASGRSVRGGADNDEGIAFYRQAIKLASNSAPAYLLLGKALDHWDKKDEARVAWEKTVSLERRTGTTDVGRAATALLSEAALSEVAPKESSRSNPMGSGR